MEQLLICSCGHSIYTHLSNGGGCATRRCKCRTCRPYNGFTLRELATMADISPSMLSRFFSRERRLSPPLFARLANVLQISQDTLLAEVYGTPAPVETVDKQ